MTSKSQFLKLSDNDQRRYIDDFTLELAHSLEMKEDRYSNLKFIVKFGLYNNILTPVIKNDEIIEIKEILLHKKTHRISIMNKGISDEERKEVYKKAKRENIDLVVVDRPPSSETVNFKTDKSVTVTENDDYA